MAAASGLPSASSSAASSGDEQLERLYRELRSYPGVSEIPLDAATANDVMLTVRLHRDQRELAFFNTITVFGTARDITLAELSIEAFYPADAETAAYLCQAGVRRKSNRSPTGTKPTFE